MKRQIVVILFCFATLGNFSLAGTLPLVLTNTDVEYNPAGNSSYFVDLDSHAGILDILSPELADKFVPVIQKTPHFGLMNSSVWLRFSIESYTDRSYILNIDNPALDTVDYYLVDSSGTIVFQQSSGTSQRIEDRPMKTSEIYIDLHLQKGQVYTCYIRARSSSMSMLMPMRIATMEQLYTQKHQTTLWNGLYFGLILFMLIYNLFLFFSLRDTSYLYFSLFIASLGLMFATYKGFGMEYLWTNYPYFNNLAPVYGCLAGVFIILFTARFLRSSVNTPTLHRWLLALSFLFIAVIVIYFFGFASQAVRLLIYNGIFALFFMMFVAMKVWNDGYGPAKYFLFSWSFFVIGLIVLLIREFGLIPINIIIGNILQISSTMSILFMSFALSKKINIYIEKRNEAQELALKSALENERLVSDQNQLLEARVMERTIDLEQTISTLQKQRTDLDDANKFKDKIFSIISHDLKSPIATLAGLLQVMKLKTLTEAEKNKVVTNLENALKATRNLLDNMLAWSVKNDRRVIETEELPLREVVDEIFLLFMYQAEAKNLTFRNLVEGNFYFYANKNMIQLILRNLVSNAIKFTPKNGIVEIAMEQEFPDLKLYVRDTGVGMTNEFVAQLFKSNAHTSTRGTENEKGTGLGLKLCKEFLEKMNGSLSVESVAGQGTTFIIHLKNAVPELESIVEKSSHTENNVFYLS